MPTGRIRGGTPIDDQDIQGRIDDPNVLATLGKLNEYFRTQELEHFHEARERALADYQPPPYSPTPDRETPPSKFDLPTPSTTPPTVHPRPPRMQPQRPPEDEPKPATTLANISALKVPRSERIRALIEKANAEPG
ncbi:MAG: hypothetical protein Q9196_006491, partial [Gyalolechia fulgens]